MVLIAVVPVLGIAALIAAIAQASDIATIFLCVAVFICGIFQVYKYLIR